MRLLQLLSVTASSFRIPGTDPWHAKPSDPAVTVMTDFRERTSITVPDQDPIDAALDHMKHTGVRCAFAVDADNQAVIGMITAYDISGDKPLRLMRAINAKRNDILVRDLMHPIRDWRVLHIRDLERANVAEVERVFDESRLTHIPVIEQGPHGDTRLRGLLSSAKVKRLLAP